MALLAPIIGAEKTREYFLDKFLELCTNENYDVRKMCAVFCPHLCKVMGVEISEKNLVRKKKLNNKSFDIKIDKMIANLFTEMLSSDYLLKIEFSQ